MATTHALSADSGLMNTCQSSAIITRFRGTFQGFQNFQESEEPSVRGLTQQTVGTHPQALQQQLKAYASC